MRRKETLVIPPPKRSAPKPPAPRVKPPAKSDRLCVAKKGQVEQLAAWLQSWGLSGELIAEGRERYFDIRIPDYWNADRRRRFKAGLKLLAGE